MDAAKIAANREQLPNGKPPVAKPGMAGNQTPGIKPLRKGGPKPLAGNVGLKPTGMPKGKESAILNRLKSK